jgi:hypothetical protein
MTIKAYPAYFIYTLMPFDVMYEDRELGDFYFIIFPDLLMKAKPYPMEDYTVNIDGISFEHELLDHKHPDFKRIRDWNNQGNGSVQAGDIDLVVQKAEQILAETLRVRRENALSEALPSNLEKLTWDYFEEHNLQFTDYFGMMAENEIVLSKSFVSFAAVNEENLKFPTLYKDASNNSLAVQIKLSRENLRAAAMLGIDIQAVGLKALWDSSETARWGREVL